MAGDDDTVLVIDISDLVGIPEEEIAQETVTEEVPNRVPDAVISTQNQTGVQEGVSQGATVKATSALPSEMAVQLEEAPERSPDVAAQERDLVRISEELPQASADETAPTLPSDTTVQLTLGEEEVAGGTDPEIDALLASALGESSGGIIIQQSGAPEIAIKDGAPTLKMPSLNLSIPLPKKSPKGPAATTSSAAPRSMPQIRNDRSEVAQAPEGRLEATTPQVTASIEHLEGDIGGMSDEETEAILEDAAPEGGTPPESDPALDSVEEGTEAPVAEESDVTPQEEAADTEEDIDEDEVEDADSPEEGNDDVEDAGDDDTPDSEGDDVEEEAASEGDNEEDDDDGELPEDAGSDTTSAEGDGAETDAEDTVPEEEMESAASEGVDPEFAEKIAQTVSTDTEAPQTETVSMPAAENLTTPSIDYKQPEVDPFEPQPVPSVPARGAIPVESMPVTLTFEVGRNKVTVGELEQLKEGYTFECGNPTESPVTICANDAPIGVGELIDVDGRIGVRVIKFYSK
ncbi:MAG: FliM/FliN family flagellar motor switch protein [Verrucomicrobiota bacterium]|nr:MAG: FliM/FliN family flagellar motor switch protein [Verrucomicrobiota bacterium]